MRLLLAMCLVVTASSALRAQQSAAPATPRQRDINVRDIAVEVIGCVDGSILTETDQVDTSRPVFSGPDRPPEAGRFTGRWKLAASKEMARQMREYAHRELRVVGTTKSNARVKVVKERPVGKRGRVYVGTAADRLDEPAPVNPPTLRVASFSPANNRCQ
jgi:hypothetical protein